MATINCFRVGKRFGGLEVLKDIDLVVEEGEFLVLVGPSGCGKSTLLGLIAGLEEISSGDILISGRSVKGIHPSERDIAMVFQSYALYPSMSVGANMAFGLEMRKIPKEAREHRVAEVAKTLQIDHLLNRRPGQLSGGQRQRVAMGRALVRDPQVFLFDEPLSNLDAKLRVEMRTEIKRLHQSLKTTMVYVTHDQIEALTLATRIAVLKDGILQQHGTPNEIYNRPRNRFVAQFMGSPSMNLIPAILRRQDGTATAHINRKTEQAITLPMPPSVGSQLADGAAIEVGLRPETITDVTASEENGFVAFECVADVVEPAGSDTFLITRLGDKEIAARIRAETQVVSGDRVRLSIDRTKATFFDAGSGMRLAAAHEV